MRSFVVLEIESGEKTCARRPGKFCRFFGSKKFGSIPVCMLFPSKLYAYTELKEVDGWTQRCDACMTISVPHNGAGFCEAYFECLLKDDPTELIALLAPGRLSDADLTFAAEIAGRIKDSELVRPALLALLDHPNPIVVEGAIYGLGNHLNDEVRNRFYEIIKNNGSNGIKEVARDALER